MSADRDWIDLAEAAVREGWTPSEIESFCGFPATLEVRRAEQGIEACVSHGGFVSTCELHGGAVPDPDPTSAQAIAAYADLLVKAALRSFTELKKMIEEAGS